MTAEPRFTLPPGTAYNIPEGRSDPSAAGRQDGSRIIQAIGKPELPPRPTELTPRMNEPLSEPMSRISTHLEAIKALCREYGVVRLDVFGSATTTTFDLERSDIDLLVEYDPNTDLGPWLKRHFEFQRRLSALLGFPVDLTMTGGLRNPYFIQAINDSRRLIYAA